MMYVEGGAYRGYIIGMFAQHPGRLLGGLGLGELVVCGEARNRARNQSVDSTGRDGPDTPIYVIHYKKPKISEQVDF